MSLDTALTITTIISIVVGVYLLLLFTSYAISLRRIAQNTAHLRQAQPKQSTPAKRPSTAAQLRARQQLERLESPHYAGKRRS